MFCERKEKKDMPHISQVLGRSAVCEGRRTSRFNNPLSGIQRDCTSCLSTSTAPFVGVSRNTAGLLIPRTLSASGEAPVDLLVAAA